jgi:hypothetical protein
MAKKKELGRIYFPRNPWPKGHEIRDFVWSGRIERATGVWFDLHLTTVEYYAEDPSSGPNFCDDADVESDNWRSKTVWCNFHQCTLSSTYWKGQAYGFQVGCKEKPLDFSKFTDRSFSFDLKPDLKPPRPFGIYLTGHDEVSGHRLKFTRLRGKAGYAIKWTGKIAQSYYGSKDFRYRFVADVNAVKFEGLVVPFCSSDQEAKQIAEPFIRNVFTDWTTKVVQNEFVLLPKMM